MDAQSSISDRETTMENVRVAHSVGSAAAIAGIGRSTLYAAIRDRRLVARKIGRRTIILVSDLQNWLQSLPVATADGDKRRDDTD